jgi:hypothetical protein
MGKGLINGNTRKFAVTAILSVALNISVSLPAYAQDVSGGDQDIPRTGGVPDFNGMWVRESGKINTFDQSVGSYEEQEPPLNPEYMKIYKGRLAARARGEPNDDPTAACIPSGLVRLYNMVLPSEIVQTGNMMYWAMEWNRDYIRIYLDGRDLPEDLYPTYNGFSRGNWDGDTLVIETVALRGDTLLDSSAVPHTDQLTVVNEMRYLDADTIESIVTLTDPGALTEPWTAPRKYFRAPDDYRMLEYICLENNRNPIGADGKTQAILQGYEE